MNKTINDIIREVVEGEGELCSTCGKDKDQFSKEWEYAQCQTCSMVEGEGKSEDMSSYGLIVEGDGLFCSNCADNPLNKCYLFVYRCANCFTDFQEPIPSEIEIPKCPKCGYKSEGEGDDE